MASCIRAEMQERGRTVKPAQVVCFRLFGCDTESDASVQRDSFKLEVAAVAVGVRPRAADARPDLVARWVSMLSA